MKIAYIIPRISHGGGMANIVAEVKLLKAIFDGFKATVIAVEPQMSADLVAEAYAAGIKVFLMPSASILNKLIETADLLVVHYWNCPSMYGFFKYLSASGLPHRLIVSVRVNGCTLPQVVPYWVNASAGGLIHVNRNTPVNAVNPGIMVKVIPSILRLPEDAPHHQITDNGTFRLFYAGAINFFKAHPRLIELHEGLAIPHYLFDIWGAGIDNTFQHAISVAKQVHYKGFSKSIYDDIKPYHMLCNPQTKFSYGSFDKIIKESQWMGKPAITLKEAYVSDNIVDGINGIVAADEDHYRSVIEQLAADPSAYRRLSRSTLEYTRANFKLVDYAKQTADLYTNTMSVHPKAMASIRPPDSAFEAALDGMGKCKAVILNNPEKLSKIEINYALRCEGGLIQFYKAYEADVELKQKIVELIEIEQTGNQ